MADQPPVSTREAVLASLLAHACVFILILLFPDLFKWSGRSPFAPASPDTPVRVEFLTPPGSKPIPASEMMGDGGKQKRSDPRPPNAPEPRNDDPYSIGNTRNRFVAPPMPEHTKPSPQPGNSGSGDSGQPEERLADEREPEPGERATAEDDASTADPSRSAFYTPKRGGGGPGRPRAGTLKEALGKMSTGMSGNGAPLKFDNPAGGLSGPMGGLSFDTPGFDWGPYARRIYWIIWTNWTRGWPPAAWAGMKGIVTVHFTIHRDGRITDITVVDESGTPAFDTCATLALEASSPLPQLPSDFPKESEGITARFLYNTESGL